MKHVTKPTNIPSKRLKPSSFTILLRHGALLALLGGVAFAQSSVEDRLKVLEDQLAKLTKENQSLRRELGIDGKSGLVEVKPAGKEPVLSLGGLVQAQAEFGDKGDTRFGSAKDRFFLRRARINASGRFLEDFDFKVEGEFANSLAGSTTAASSALTDGYINWSQFSWANVKVGQFKTPFGYEFLASDPKLYTIERTLGSDRLTLSRQVGAQVSGDLFDKDLSYALGVFNGTGQNVSANDNEKFLWVGRVSAVGYSGKLAGEALKWTIGTNAFTSQDSALSVASDFGMTGNSFTGSRYGTGADTQLKWGPLDLWTEYLMVDYKPTNRVPANSVQADAYYLQAACYVVPSLFQLTAKYDVFDPSNMASKNETQTWTFGLNTYLKGDDIKLQVNYLIMDIPNAAHQGKLILRAQTIF